MKKAFVLIAIFILPAPYFANCQTPILALQKKHGEKETSSATGGGWFFKVNLSNGEKLSNIFSRTVAYHCEEFADIVQRVSGTATYTVIDNNPQAPVFESSSLYDGRPEGGGRYTVRNDGQSIYNGKLYQDESASGLLFNSFIWGVPPSTLREGDQWENVISQPWELGGPGKQTVHVMQIDKLHHSITLKREGSSEGFYDHDAKQITVTLKDGKKVKMDLVPGKTNWSGYTTFKNGVVISDELLVTRPVSWKNDSLAFNGLQREYILLNAMPSQ
jgi:hypothetical protein